VRAAERARREAQEVADGRTALSLAAAIGGAGVLHLGRGLRLRSRVAVSAVALAPVSLIPAAAAEAVLLANRRWAAAGAGSVVLAGCVVTQVVKYRRSRRSDLRRHGADVGLTVMTANLLHGGADPDDLARVTADNDVDVLCVQEVHQTALDALADSLADRLPHHHSRPGSQGGGSGVFSRFPLADRKEPPGFGFPPVMADVLVPTVREPGTRVITVLSFHGKAPLGNGGTHAWSADLALAGRFMRQHPGSLIVAGDFNATREHRQFRDLLTGGFTDAAQDAGAGLLPTFPAEPRRIPLACLDHVLVGRGLTGIEVWTEPTTGSDHRAVIARIAAD
jgi:endonuclease/exonuclease/phosphatase (EEP) superfamily protein YafD